MKYTRVYDTEGNLVAYKSEAGVIEVVDFMSYRSYYGAYRREYKVNGYAFDTLKEAKKELEQLV